MPLDGVDLEFDGREDVRQAINERTFGQDQRLLFRDRYVALNGRNGALRRRPGGTASEDIAVRFQ